MDSFFDTLFTVVWWLVVGTTTLALALMIRTAVSNNEDTTD
jgi:hypothetical protein